MSVDNWRSFMIHDHQAECLEKKGLYRRA
ncbi:PerC family transcriptional regulator, partial [Escherichia albertii]